MTGPQTITSDHLRSLLDAQDGGAIIGLAEGEIRIIDSAARDADENRGALEVITRDELQERLGADPSDDAIEEQAAALTATTQELGG